MAHQSLNLKTLPPLPSLKDMALSAIKEAILYKKLEPGVMYTEAAVSSELGISRTPIREALIHLASRGFIIYMARKGFQIRVLMEKDVKNLFELRMALELAVIRHITPKLTEESMIKIENLLSKYTKATEAGNPIESINADRELHLSIAHLTDNPFLINAIEEIRDLIDLASIRSLEIEYRTTEAIKEHQEIIDMLKARSLEGALEKMEEHLRITGQRVLSRIKAVE
jgi:DNA-binding GntR family transcriptional regulator